MSSYNADVELYRNFDPQGIKSVEDIANEFAWPRQKSYIYKYFISELNKQELILLDKTITPVNLGVIAAVCIQNAKHKLQLLQNIERINKADSPFREIEILIDEISDLDPLQELKKEYWIAVGTYINERGVDIYPFNKKAAGFLKSVAYNLYSNLSARQKKWIKGLIAEDKLRVKTDRFFINEELIRKGFEKECSIIEKYEECH